MKAVSFHKFVLFIIVVSVLGLATVYSRASAVDAGYRVERLRSEMAELERERANLRFKAEALKTPERLLGILRDNGIRLEHPSPSHMVEPDGGREGEALADSRARTPRRDY